MQTPDRFYELCLLYIRIVNEKVSNSKYLIIDQKIAHQKAFITNSATIFCITTNFHFDDSIKRIKRIREMESSFIHTTYVK